MRILFIVKEREYGDYGGGYSYSGPLGGLYNSASFVVDMLLKHKIVAKLVQVVDNNSIDREVALFKPDIVVIEALWVVPSKFAILAKLHPKVKWVVRVHSEIPFLAVEGIAIGWIIDYLNYPNVSVAANSPRMLLDLRNIILEHYGDLAADTKVSYLPNWYPMTPVPKHAPTLGELNIACFGAIRPLKNQLIQALAAIEYADRVNQVVNFHVNSTRCEQNGDNVLRNIRALFAGTAHKLVEHEWETHADFMKTMAGMDVSLAVSFSETFNITTADAVAIGVPIVVSSEITWASPASFSATTTTSSIVAVIDKVLVTRELIKQNQENLTVYDAVSTTIWLDYLKG